MKRLLVGSAVLAFVLVAVAGVVVVRRHHHGAPEVCRAMDAPVPGLGAIAWDNGYTYTGSELESVLTNGVQHAKRPDRVKIATAVKRDDAGYQRLHDALPTDLRPALERLRALAVDAGAGYAHRKDAQVSADVRRIGGYAIDRCNLL
jgi:hypothetical protein